MAAVAANRVAISFGVSGGEDIIFSSKLASKFVQEPCIDTPLVVRAKLSQYRLDLNFEVYS